MTKPLKNISKSVRMTEELYHYINDYYGDGFNQKFENVILDARFAEPERLKKLAVLDQQVSVLESEIKAKRERLQELTSKVRKLGNEFTWF